MTDFRQWSALDVAAHNARVAGVPVVTSRAIGATEAELHGHIFDECRRRGWIALHGSMSERTHRTLGEWDFVIIANGGRVLLVECKIGNGKLTREQLALHHWARTLGHAPAVVTSIEEFIQIANTTQ